MPDDLPTRRDTLIGMTGTAALARAATQTGQDICFLTAAELVRLIKNKKVSAREVMKSQLMQMVRFNQ
jgi:hypothetical protein